jgi:hypothetical protein
MQRKNTEVAARKEGARGISYILYCERKERYVERLWTTTTNSITDKARRDKTKVAIT